MPLYAYRCPEGHEFEEIRRTAERDKPVPCPCCEYEAERVQATPSVKVEGGTGKFHSYKGGP